MTVLAAIGEDQNENPVISVAYDLALAYDDDLVVLHVIPEEEFEERQQSIPDDAGWSDYSFTQEESSAARFARRLVDGTLDEFDDDVISAVGRVGDPLEMILATSEETDARYVVIGGKQRTPTGKAIFGSVTQSVLLNATVPVMTVMMDKASR